MSRATHARAHAPPDAPPRTSAAWPGVPDAHAPRLLSRWHRSLPMRFETLSTSWASVSLAARRRGGPRLLHHPASPTHTDTPLSLSCLPHRPRLSVKTRDGLLGLTTSEFRIFFLSVLQYIVQTVVQVVQLKECCRLSPSFFPRSCMIAIADTASSVSGVAALNRCQRWLTVLQCLELSRVRSSMTVYRTTELGSIEHTS